MLRQLSHPSLATMAVVLTMTLAVTWAAPRGVLARAPLLHPQRGVLERPRPGSVSSGHRGLHTGYRVPKLAEMETGDFIKRKPDVPGAGDSLYFGFRVPPLAGYGDEDISHDGGAVSRDGHRVGLRIPKLAV